MNLLFSKASDMQGNMRECELQFILENLRFEK